MDKALHLKMARLSVFLFAISILGAISGYARELVLAITYGAGGVTDAYFVAANIPAVITDLLIGSVLTASVIPSLTSIMVGDIRRSLEIPALFSAFAIAVVIVTISLALIVIANLSAIVNLLAEGLTVERKQLVTDLAHWLIWLLPLNALLLLSSFSLNAAKIFIAPAFTSIIINFTFCVVLIIGGGASRSIVVAAIIGPVVMLAVNFLWLFKAGFIKMSKPSFGSSSFYLAMRLSKPVLLSVGIGSGLGLLMISHLILRKYGSALEDGSISALGYAFRIYEVPISLITATVGIQAMPLFSGFYNAQNYSKAAEIATELFDGACLILVPIVVLVWMDSIQIVSLLFEYGRFNREATELTASALRGFSPAIFLEAVFMVAFRILYSLHRPGIAVLSGGLSLLSLTLLLSTSYMSGSVSHLSSALSISFFIAAFSSIYGIGYVLGRNVIPRFKFILRVALAAVFASTVIYLWRSLFSDLSMVSWFIETSFFCATYVLFVTILIPEKIRKIRELVSI